MRMLQKVCNCPLLLSQPETESTVEATSEQQVSVQLDELFPPGLDKSNLTLFSSKVCVLKVTLVNLCLHLMLKHLVLTSMPLARNCLQAFGLMTPQIK